MNRAKGHSKLPPPLCEVEDYYNSYSSSPLLKIAFKLETEVEFSKTVIMPVITIDTNNLEEEMTAMKAMPK